MGEYWQVCNLTKREAYDTRGNYKTRGAMTYQMRGALLWLLGTDRWNEADDIRLLSDLGQSRVISKETWDATEEHGTPPPLDICDLIDIHFVVQPERSLLPSVADKCAAKGKGAPSEFCACLRVTGFRHARDYGLCDCLRADCARFDEEKPPTPKASRYEPEADE